MRGCMHLVEMDELIQPDCIHQAYPSCKESEKSENQKERRAASAIDKNHFA